ncbi:glycosyltransferase [Staphylococcus pseudintermedius]|nr:glycosyltransferase [Staphylococcus pseudintermedius]
MTTYNSEASVLKTVYSALNQSIEASDYEIIVVDDCSTDETFTLLKGLQGDNLKIFQLDENSGGPSKPRNIGIEKARGEYIFFLDGDDWLDENILEKVKGLDTCSKSDLIITRVIKDRDGKQSEHARFMTIEEVKHKNHEDLPYFYYYLGPIGKFVKRKILINHNIRFRDDLVFGEDKIFFMNCYNKINKVTVTKNISAYINRSQDNQSIVKKTNFIDKRKSDEEFFKEALQLSSRKMKNKFLVRILEYDLLKNVQSMVYLKMSLDERKETFGIIRNIYTHASLKKHLIKRIDDKYKSALDAIFEDDFEKFDAFFHWLQRGVKVTEYDKKGRQVLKSTDDYEFKIKVPNAHTVNIQQTKESLLIQCRVDHIDAKNLKDILLENREDYRNNKCIEIIKFDNSILTFKINMKLTEDLNKGIYNILVRYNNYMLCNIKYGFTKEIDNAKVYPTINGNLSLKVN